MVTDYDCWHDDHAAVDVAQVIATLVANSGRAKALVTALPAHLPHDRSACPDGCDHALTHALMTAPDKRDSDLVAMLATVAGRVLR